MAQFLENNPKPKKSEFDEGSGFNAFGKEVPVDRRKAALQHMKDMGVNDAEDCWTCIGGMCNAIKRDDPYEAVKIGMRYLDLTGTYRLLAALCTGKEGACE